MSCVEMRTSGLITKTGASNLLVADSRSPVSCEGITAYFMYLNVKQCSSVHSYNKDTVIVPCLSLFRCSGPAQNVVT